MTEMLTDSFGRQITYLRLSVTDRCDLRCTYCMAESMTFLPRKELLTLEELGDVSEAFIARGVRKIRLTGGEPLVRRDVMTLVRRLGDHAKAGRLDEVTMTTNGTLLSKYAAEIADCGVKRINISLDSRDPEVFAKLSRRDVLPQVLTGIEAARQAGLKIKINMVALKGVNDHEVPEMMRWAHGQGMDLTLIEVMPMGSIDEDRFDQYLPLTATRDRLEEEFTLTDIADRTGGPARYSRVLETGGRLGLITPLTNNFCADCNRLRVTCTGQIYMCLGQSDHVDLREALRGENPEQDLNVALDRAMLRKPEKHDFEITSGSAPAVSRHMSVTGG
ncbi:GTP 3',8-cyclase MoaA [Litorimonas sp. RW-G-Af-16]|uniref:GTP 3',8-cyclase MoaA n=1 Tax=Litorimonas sp. RW-G-Af-16 TaxID=3241168 RepID=UPI00390C99AF